MHAPPGPTPLALPLPLHTGRLGPTGDSAYFIEASAASKERLVRPDTRDGWGEGEEGDPVGIITIEDVIEEVGPFI